MSRGNPKIVVRVEPDVMAAIEAAIASANYNRKERPYDMSSWVRQAIFDKLNHLVRSKKRKKAD